MQGSFYDLSVTTTTSIAQVQISINSEKIPRSEIFKNFDDTVNNVVESTG